MRWVSELLESVDHLWVSRLHGLVLTGLLVAALTPTSALAQEAGADDAAAIDDVVIIDDGTGDAPAVEEPIAADDEAADPCDMGDDGNAAADDSEAEAVDPSVPDDEPVVDATSDDGASFDDACDDTEDAVAPTMTAAPLRLRVAGPGAVRATFYTRPGGAVIGRATARASRSGAVVLTPKLTAAGRTWLADKGTSVRLTVKLKGRAVGTKRTAGTRKVTLRLVASTPAS